MATFSGRHVTGGCYGLGMKLRTQRRLALGILIAVALLAIAYGVYWCMEPGKVHDATTDVPPIAGAR